MGSVTEIDEAAVRRLASIFALLVDFALIAGGSPCQDLSSLNAAGKGLEGIRSSLSFEIHRIFELFSRHFAAKIFLMVGNVFSMTAESRRAFSAALGMNSFLVDAKWFTLMKKQSCSGATGKSGRPGKSECCRKRDMLRSKWQESLDTRSAG